MTLIIRYGQAHRSRLPRRGRGPTRVLLRRTCHSGRGRNFSPHGDVDNAIPLALGIPQPVAQEMQVALRHITDGEIRNRDRRCPDKSCPERGLALHFEGHCRSVGRQFEDELLAPPRVAAAFRVHRRGAAVGCGVVSDSHEGVLAD